MPKDVCSDITSINKKGGKPQPFKGRASVDNGAEEDNEGMDLDQFDRSTFAQVKKGSLLNHYELLEEVGSGSFGVVNRAKENNTDNIFAVKTIPIKKVSNPKKIKDEFNVIRQLDHPHICKAFECYEDRRNIYLVLELLTGGTLLETMIRQTKFSEADAANIMRQIMRALAYLHETNFIFRDLKTENVMFGRPVEVQEGKISSEIKLIDFGLCCPFEKGQKIAKAAGTPYSVAPELVTSPVQYDQKCDAWSAGVVMYIMLSGKYPFNGKTKDELLHCIRKEPVSFKHRIWLKISKDAKTLLAELLRKKADSRITVGGALQHPWLQISSELPTDNIMADVVGSFKHFQTLNMFQKAAITALAWKATDDDTKQLRELFSMIDRDGSGHISVGELRECIEKSGVVIPPDLDILSIQADTDGNNTIEYTEFIAACMDKRKVIKENVVWEAFRIFDQDGSGTITKKEMLKIMNSNAGDGMRRAHGNKVIDHFVDTYDVSGDDVIDYEEFMEMLSNVAQTFEKRDELLWADSAHKAPGASASPSGFARFCPGLSACSSVSKGEQESIDDKGKSPKGPREASASKDRQQSDRGGRGSTSAGGRRSSQPTRKRGSV